MSQLREICGSKEEAERYYDLLQDYHLLEEDGSAVEHWAITMDGKEMTLAELRALLNGSYDGKQIVEVDGTPVSLADLAVILEPICGRPTSPATSGRRSRKTIWTV